MSVENDRRERERCLAWTRAMLRDGVSRWPWLAAAAVDEGGRFDRLAEFVADAVLRQQWAARLVDDTERDMAAAYQDAQHHREKAEAALEIAAKYAECYAGAFPDNVKPADMAKIRAARRV